MDVRAIANGDCLISGDCGVDGARPGVDASGEGLSMSEALIA
jgi:hypothetical protein